MNHTIDKAQVQHFLNGLSPEKPFTVIFTTQKGEQRQYEGTLVPSINRGELVPFQTAEGAYKSFRIDSVLYIGEAS